MRPLTSEQAHEATPGPDGPRESSKPAGPAALPRPSVSGRLLAAVSYAGFAPLVHRAIRRRNDPFTTFHHAQALGLWFGLFCVFLFYVIVAFCLSYVLVFKRSWYEDTALEPTLLTAVRWSFLCWIVFWAFAIAWGLAGSWRYVPIVGGLGDRAWVRKTALVWNAIVLVTASAVAGGTAHARSLARSDEVPGSAYMLYDDMGFIPHWVFDLGFYPIALEATSKWGRGSVVVKPLTKDGLADALHDGRFVFVLSHGTEEGLYTRKLKIRPTKAAPKGTGPHLQFVYITGCDSGALRRQWESVLAPARVVTFDRLSAWLEHIFWLLFQGAAEVHRLE